MFTTTIGMECRTEGCPGKGKLLGVRAVGPCKLCVKPTFPVKKPNLPAIIGAGVIGALLLGGAGYYAYKNYTPSTPGGNGPIAVAPAGVPSFSYAVQLEDGGFRNVADTQKFRGGDKFRILVKPSFQAYVYCFHEDSATGDMDILATGSQPLDAGLETTVPPSGTIHMDTQPAPEKFTLIASAKPLPELEFSAGSHVTKSQLQSISDRIFQSVAESTTPDGGWTVVHGKSKDASLLRAMFTLKHE